MRDDELPSGTVLVAGPPALLASVAVPLVALALVLYRATTTGLASTPEDPVSPWLIAMLTLGFALVLSWRSITQRAVLGLDGLSSRNLSGSYHVEWDQVDRLQIVRRPGLVLIEVHVDGLRRRQRIGAATRFAGDEALVVEDVIRAHPRAGALLQDQEP